MRIEQLQYFIEVANARSINAASNKLHISQQSLNTTLKNLEAELDVSLLHTTNRGTFLTPQGEILLSASKDILSRYNLLKSELQQSLSPISGSIKIQVMPSMSESLIPNILQIFCSQHPLIHISFQEHEHLQILQSICTGDADLGIFGIQEEIIKKFLHQFAIPSDIEFVPLYQYKIALAVSTHSPLAKYKSISIASAIKFPFVIHALDDLDTNFTYLWLKSYGKNLNIKFTTSSANIYKNIISTGQAVGVYLSKRHCGINIPIEDSITLIPLKGKGSTCTVGYLFNRQKPITSAMQIFIDELISYCV